MDPLWPAHAYVAADTRKYHGPRANLGASSATVCPSTGPLTRPLSQSGSSAILAASELARRAGRGGCGEPVVGRHPGAGTGDGHLGSVSGQALRRPWCRSHQGRTPQRRSCTRPRPVGRRSQPTRRCRQPGTLTAVLASEHQQTQRHRRHRQPDAQRQ